MAGELAVAGRGAYVLQAFCRIGLLADGGSPWLLMKTVGQGGKQIDHLNVGESNET